MAFTIGICTRYGADCLTLAFLIFKDNGDVILSQHFGNVHALDDGTKWNPHVTYHADGVFHVASYDVYHADQQRQPLDDCFGGVEQLPRQSFGRFHAQAFGRRCDYDDAICVDADDLPDRFHIIEDAQHRIETHAALAMFQIDLVQPHTDPPDPRILKERIIAQKTFTQTFPWCRVTILTMEPATS